MQFCYLISAVLTQRGLYCEIPLAVLIQRSLLTKLILERGDKFGFQNGGVSSPELREIEAKTFQRDCVFPVFCTFFGCFLHFLCFSPRTYLVVSSLFNFCIEMRGSSNPVIFSEPESKTLERKGEKNS